MRWRIEHDYREFKRGLGLDHYQAPAPSVYQTLDTINAAAPVFQVDGRVHEVEHNPKQAYLLAAPARASNYWACRSKVVAVRV